MIVSLAKWGNGMGIHIPKSIIENMNLNVNSKLEIVEVGDSIQLKPINRVSTLDELFADYDAEMANYEVKEIDFGKPEGNEVW